MIAASIIMGRALAPVEIAVANWKGFVSARAAYDRICALLGIIPPEEKKMSLPAPVGDLAVEGLMAGAPGRKDPEKVRANVGFLSTATDMITSG